MANTGMLMKQKAKLLNQTDSLNMIKNVVRLGISVITYLRDLFSERAYDDVVFQGMTLKMLKRVDKQSDVLLNWLDQGIFDAIEKKYLQMLIFDINDIDDNTIECYKFTFSYNREDGTSGIDLSVESIMKGNNNQNNHRKGNVNDKKNKDVGIDDETAIIRNAQRLNEIRKRLLGIPNNSSPTIPLTTNISPNHASQKDTAIEADKQTMENIKRNYKKETAKRAKQLLETLVTLTSDLGPLPEKTYLSMKLLYYDEYTPADYQPNLFREPDEQDLISFQKKPDLLNVGALGTDHHALSVSISTTCTANRSWTVEELYEQLILIERKKNIKKSLSSINEFDDQNDHVVDNDQTIKQDNANFRNVKTNYCLHNDHDKHNPCIRDTGEEQKDSAVEVLSDFENTPTKQLEMLHLATVDNIDKQNEIKEGTIENKNDNVGHVLEKEEKEEEVEEKEGNTMEIVIEITTSEEEENTTTDEKKIKENEDEIKSYILSKQVASKHKLRKLYKYTPDATFCKILNSLEKKGILKHSKNGVYRFCDVTNVPPPNENNAYVDKQNIEQQYIDKQKKDKIIKESIKQVKPNKDDLTDFNSLKNSTKDVFNNIPQNFVPLAKENDNSLRLKEKANNVNMKIPPFVPPNNIQDQSQKIVKNGCKEKYNHLNCSNDKTKAGNNKNQKLNDTNVKTVLSNWIHESNNTNGMYNDFAPRGDNNKNETHSDTNACESLYLKKKYPNEIKGKKEDIEQINAVLSNNDLNHMDDSGNNSYSKAFNEIEKLYSDVFQSCKTTKYINKEIISKGLGIEPKLAKPLLDRLIRDGYVNKKHIKNKGHESLLYEPIQINYKRKLLPKDTSKNNEICQLSKKIHR